MLISPSLTKKLFEKLRAENIIEAVDVVDDLRLI